MNFQVEHLILFIFYFLFWAVGEILLLTYLIFRAVRNWELNWPLLILLLIAINISFIINIKKLATQGFHCKGFLKISKLQGRRDESCDELCVIGIWENVCPWNWDWLKHKPVSSEYGIHFSNMFKTCTAHKFNPNPTGTDISTAYWFTVCTPFHFALLIYFWDTNGFLLGIIWDLQISSARPESRPAVGLSKRRPYLDFSFLLIFSFVQMKRFHCTEVNN